MLLDIRHQAEHNGDARSAITLRSGMSDVRSMWRGVAHISHQGISPCVVRKRLTKSTQA